MRSAHTTKDFIKSSENIHGNKYDYSKVEYINNYTKVCIICPEHGEFWQTKINHVNLKHNCPKCGKNNTAKNKTLTQHQVIEKFRCVHGEKYDYSKVKYIKTTIKVCIICPEHGEFWQMPATHFRGGGCVKCSRIILHKNNTKNHSHFYEKAQYQHKNKYDYSKVKYIDAKTKVCIICPKHGEFWQEPHNHYKGANCPKCPHTQITSNQELTLGDKLSKYIKMVRSDRNIISPLELDIFIPSKKIAIEYNGLYWHSENHGKNRNYHLNKTQLCVDKDIQLIHIFEDEWLSKQHIVMNRLKAILSLTEYKIYARKCEVREIDNQMKNKFLEKYHIQGNDMSSIRLGLFYGNRLVAVMTFAKRRFDKKEGYELVRYCTVGHFTVVGGAGKLLKHFERTYKPITLISYADKRWSNGGLYKALRFKHTHDSRPNYWYFKNQKRYSRHQFMKHKLKDKLKVFNKSLTEWENMKLNGWDRIWDCGNMVFEKIY